MKTQNWKTAAAGVAAILGAVASLIGMFSKGQVDGNILMTDLGVIGAGVAGLFAKDHDVTGGTVPQDGGTIPAIPTERK